MRVPPTDGDFSSRDSGGPSQQLAEKLAHDITADLQALSLGKVIPGENMVLIFHKLRENMTELLQIEKDDPRHFTLQQKQTAEILNFKIQLMADQMSPPTAEQFLDALNDAQRLLA